MVTCGACGFERSEVADQTPGQDPQPPAAGDFWLCSRCGQLHRFHEVISLVRMRFELVVLPCADEYLILLEQGARRQLLAAREQIRAKVVQ